MEDINNTIDTKCRIDTVTKTPIVDDKYFDSNSMYQKCKCIDKMKSSFEILAKNQGYGYQSYVDIYKNKYSQNKCDEVFKNYVATNVEDIYGSVTKQDKERIESQSKKERNQRIYIGVAVFAVAIGMISIYATRKN
jgi:hypothetical protein